MRATLKWYNTLENANLAEQGNKTASVFSQ